MTPSPAGAANAGTEAVVWTARGAGDVGTATLGRAKDRGPAEAEWCGATLKLSNGTAGVGCPKLQPSGPQAPKPPLSLDQPTGSHGSPKRDTSSML